MLDMAVSSSVQSTSEALFVRDDTEIVWGGHVSGQLGSQQSRPRWREGWDVLVVGSGYAGLTAAIEAHDRGASVAILEKRRTIGGNSVIAGGVYNAVDPERQKAQGIEDSIELHYDQTWSGGDFRGEPAKIRYLVEHALEGWQWLETMGVENFELFQAYGALWARSHRPKYRGSRNGAAIVKALADQVKARRIPVLRQHKMAGLHREKLSETITGVRVETGHESLDFRAGRGLVLASGGFCADVEMRMRHDPRFDARFGTTCHGDSTGEIIRQAQDVGADLVGMDFIQSIGPTGPDVRFVRPPVDTVPLLTSLMMRIGAITVDQCIYSDLQGRRIIASDARRDAITEAVMRTPEKVCAGICDDVSRQNASYGALSLERLEEMIRKWPRQLFRAETIPELAKKLGMPEPSVLVETVRAYNACVDARYDPEFGQLPHNLVWKCARPPFWAATASPALHYMCGGLRTEGASTRVLDRWNRVIPGLFAAGEVMGGMHGTNRLGGNATAECIVFGRLAGREAAGG
jgi:urocanate reductase